MEQYFVGLLFGVVFSALFVLVGMLNRKIASKGWLPAWLVVEVLLVALAIYLLHGYWSELSGVWGKTHQWFHEYVRRPVHWFQFILGTLSGVVLRFWLVRLLVGYQLTEVDRTKLWPASKEGGEGKPADFVSRERGWVIALVGLLLLAVLLPQIERMVRSMSSLKVAGVEVAFKDQKETLRISIRNFNREQVAIKYFEDSPFEAVEKRLDSDDRTYRKGDKPIYGDASKQYLNLYDTTIGPFMACMKQLIDDGHELDTIRAWTRKLVVSWQAVASSKKDDASVELAELAALSQRLIKRSRCTNKWKRRENASTTVGGQVRNAPEFYRALAATLQVLDNRLAAIQLLEGARGKFEEHMNWHNQLAILYFDEDPTLEKSLLHFEAMLRIAEGNLARAANAVKAGRVSCPAKKGASQDTIGLCNDQIRYEKAVGTAQNGVAYVLSQMANVGQVARAVQMASGLVRSTRKTADSDPAAKSTYLAYLDTLVFAVMASEAGSPTPDADIIKCSEVAFNLMAEEWKVELIAEADNASASGFRPKYVLARSHYETAILHVNTAAVLVERMERSQGTLRCARPQLKKLLDGEY